MELPCWPAKQGSNLTCCYAVYICVYSDIYQWKAKAHFLYRVGFVLLLSLSEYACRHKEAGVSPERPFHRAIQVIIIIVSGIQRNALFILIYLEKKKCEDWQGCVRIINVLVCGRISVRHYQTEILEGRVSEKQRQWCASINVHLSTNVTIPFFISFPV